MKECLLLLFAITILGVASGTKAEVPVIDLTERDLSKNTVSLDGEWAFYWGTFLSPTDPEDSTHQLIRLPSRWTTYENIRLKGNQTYPPYGYGTYRVKVQLPDIRPSRLTIKTRRIKMAHRFFVNGEIIGGLGNPSSNPTDFISGHQPLEMDLEIPPGEATLDIIVHVANFEYAQSGIDVAPVIGAQAAIDRSARESIFSSALISGALLIMALYHLGLWVKRRKDLSTLAFGIFCLFISMRMLVTGEKYLLYIFPELSSAMMLKTEIMTVFVAMPFMHLFVMLLFRRQSSLFMFRLSIVLMAIWCSFLLLPLYWTSAVVPFFELHVLVILIHTLWIAVKAIIAREQGSLLFIAGVLCVFLTGINDILYERGFINTAFLVHAGVLLFVFAQSALLSTRFSQAFNDLEALKESLEAQVETRTLEYQNARDEALKLSDENRLLSHRITSMLESERKAIAQEIHDNFNASIAAVKFMIDNLRKPGASAESVSQSVETISKILTEIYSGARKLVRRLRPEIIDTLGLSGALEELLDNYTQPPSQLDVEYSIDPKADELDDETRIAIYRVCQEALTNVLKHSHANKVFVALTANGEDLIFTVDDNGDGINTKEAPGIGLISMRERAFSVGAELSVAKRAGGGTRVTFVKPSAWS